MTKRKKGLLFACACVSILAAGAGFGFTPARSYAGVSAATLAADEASYWKEVPHISGWSWGFFDAEKNIFRAIPDDTFSGDIEFKFYNADGQLILTAYEKVLNGEHAWYFTEYSATPLSGADLSLYLNSAFGKWDAGDYTMTAYADSQSEYKHNSVVNFSVLKGKNYWTNTPYIESWYKGEWTEAKDFPAPVAKSAYGDLVEYTIYGATDKGGIDYESVYYEGTSNPDAIPDVTKLCGAETGRYFLAAHVAGTNNYEELESIVPFRIFDSQATVAAVAAAKEDAYVQINRFAADLNVKTDVKEVRDVMVNIDNAATVTQVERWLSATKLTIFKIYARNSITKYISDLRETYGLVLDVSIDDFFLADDNSSIKDAPDIPTVEKNLAVALGKIYDEGVKEERKKASAELSEYAAKFHLEAQANFTDANTFEEVEELLALEKHNIDDRVLKEGAISDLDEYKERVKSAILNYALYVGIDFGSSQDMLKLSEIDQVQLNENEANPFQKAKDEIDVFYDAAKKFVDAELINIKYALLWDLKEFAQGYCEKYSPVTEQIFEIISTDSNTLNGSAREEMLDAEKTPTVIAAKAVYENNRSDIRDIVLPFAKIKVKEELNRIAGDAKIPEFDAQLHEFLQAVDDAQTVDEAEAVLDAASFQINNTLYTARMEMIQALDKFAADYFTAHNWSMISWNMLFGALEDGKKGIYGAKSVEEIYGAGEEAKVLFMRAYVNAELDCYSEIYADYDIGRIVETQKELSKTSSSVKGLQTILNSADEQIYRAAKINAPESLKRLSSYFKNFDYSNDIKKMESADDLTALNNAYTASVDRLNILKAEVQTARSMLEMYAESYGLNASSTPVLLAIDRIYAAASPEDLPELVKEAKADIDAAAAKEQERIGSVNAGLIVCTAIFAVMAVGFAALLIILWRKKKSPAKKSVGTETEAKEPVPEKEEDNRKPVE